MDRGSRRASSATASTRVPTRLAPAGAPRASSVVAVVSAQRPVAPFPPPLTRRVIWVGRGGIGSVRFLQRGTVGLGPPAEGEGTLHQRPVAAHGPVRSHLVLAPAQAGLDLLVLLLHPVAQAIEAHDLRQIGGDGQGRGQIPRRRFRQGGRIDRGNDQASPPIWAEWSRHPFQRPPRLGMVIAVLPDDRLPRAGLLRARPASRSRHLPDRPDRLDGGPPGVGGLEGHDIRDAALGEPAGEATMLAVQAVGHHRAQGPVLRDGLVD